MDAISYTQARLSLSAVMARLKMRKHVHNY